MSKKTRLLSLIMRSGEFKRSFDAEQIIRQGRVTVNGKIVENPNFSFKPGVEVKLDGRELKPVPFAYVILNKQVGVVCQKSRGEKTIYDVIAAIQEIDRKNRNSLFCIGRLDRDTEGLLIVTNDGHLEKLLTKKEHGILKTYSVEVKNPVSENDIAKLRKDVQIRDDDTGEVFSVRAISIRKLGERKLEMGIEEGRKRQVKKMLKAVGNDVTALKRVGIGGMRLESLDFHGKPYLIVSKKELVKMILKE